MLLILTTIHTTVILRVRIAVPAQWTKDGTFHHTMEGEDDMPGHVKSSLMGPSLNIPVRLSIFSHFLSSLPYTYLLSKIILVHFMDSEFIIVIDAIY